MIPPHSERAGEVRGVETNGIGKRTTAHLNLTRSLADVGIFAGDHPTRGTNEFKRPSYDPKSRERSRRIPYAGAE